MNELNYAGDLEMKYEKSNLSNLTLFLRRYEDIRVFFIVSDKIHNKIIVGNFFKTKLNVTINGNNFELDDKEEKY